VSGPIDRAEGRSIDVALIALARDHVWPGGDTPALPPPARLPPPADAEASPAKPDLQSLVQRLYLVSGGFSIWSVFAVLAIVPIVVLVVVWMSLRWQDDAPRASTTKGTDVAAKSDAAKSQTTGQSALAASSAASVPPQNLTQSVATLTLQVTEARQSIDRLTAGEARMGQENSELTRRLKETEEMVRRNAALVEELKAGQARLAEDKTRLEDQLRASSEQITTIAAQLSASRDQLSAMDAKLKASQEQVAHSLDPKQHPKRVSSALPTTANNQPVKLVPGATPATQAKPPAPKPAANSRPKNAQAAAPPATAPAAGTR